MKNRGFFVTATDTGAGKTAVTACLAASLIRSGRDAAALKPLETGCAQTSEGLIGPDSALLCRITGASPDLINAERSVLSAAPSVASRLAGVEDIDIDELAARVESMAPRGAIVLVEGIGGLMVPISRTHYIADLAALLGLPLLLVVANRLGCINHALLTIEAAEMRRLALAGWVLNDLDPASPDDAARSENFEELSSRIAASCLGRLPHVPGLAALPSDKLADLAGAHLSAALDLLETDSKRGA